MGNPATIVTWTPVMLSDQHPTLGQLQFTFPYKMDANPLTDVAPTDLTIRGSQPDNTALWWPNFQVRHWGEQFAPTRLSWELYELNVCPMTKTLLSSPLRHGSPWYDDPSQWMNHFPGASMEV